ncbi:GNAT family N-acyltransferase [Shimia sp.]|uniref:GNAT family N-acetyltransferase n=1 Tax=Shimia sp. TaxID=1954381 RepID=UPI003296BA39
MLGFSKGRYTARVARDAADVSAAQRLRHFAFLGGQGDDADVDPFDEICTHILVEETNTNELVCCFRLLLLNGGDQIQQSYSAQFYELCALRDFEGPIVEMGRFCIHPNHQDPDILRVAWGAMTAYVDENKVEMLIGCSSFDGTDADEYLDSFAMLRDQYIAPNHWLPKVKAPDVFRFATRLNQTPNLRRARLRMPPLLRTYLIMGGWVSDHAVVDRDLNTLHVFTGLEISAIPAARKRLLRAIAA